MEAHINQSTLILKIGDITKETTDAIVNAANSGLRGGSGVDGAIHRAGGPAIMAECRRIGTCTTGSAVLTTAGNLKAKYVIHAVGPIYRDGKHGEEKLLYSAYASSLHLAAEHHLTSVAFPALSAGAYGYPLQDATHIGLKAVTDYLEAHTEIQTVTFVLFNEGIYTTFSRELSKMLATT
jgi:O-acetyl-ADP-ribose deacetylase (regulator of RNase III)